MRLLAYGQFPLTKRSFTASNLVVKTGRSLSTFAEPMNDRFQGCRTPAGSAGTMSQADKKAADQAGAKLSGKSKTNNRCGIPRCALFEVVNKQKFQASNRSDIVPRSTRSPSIHLVWNSSTGIACP